MSATATSATTTADTWVRNCAERSDAAAFSRFTSAVSAASDARTASKRCLPSWVTVAVAAATSPDRRCAIAGAAIWPRQSAAARSAAASGWARSCSWRATSRSEAATRSACAVPESKGSRNTPSPLST